MTSRRISLSKRTEPEAAAEPAPEAAPAAGKGRPTPKRSDAQKRKGPVAPPPTSRREAARRLRERQAADRKAVREGTAAGDPGRMLPRDAGPVRAWVRDAIDSRRNLAVLLLPVALVLVLAQITQDEGVLSVAIRLWTITLLAVVFDLVSLAVGLRRRLREQFPGTRTRSHVFYGLMRSTVLRRFRMPPPRVAPRPFSLRRR